MEGMTAKEVNSAMKKKTEKKRSLSCFPRSTYIQQNIRKESRFGFLIWYQRPLFTVTIQQLKLLAVGCALIHMSTHVYLTLIRIDQGKLWFCWL